MKNKAIIFDGFDGSYDLFIKSQNLYSRYVSKDSICIDVGANCGATALAMFNNIEDGRVIAIEPNHVSFNMLKSNIQKNNIQKYFDIYNFGLGDTNLELDYVSSLSNDNGGILNGFTIEERGSLQSSYKIKIFNGSDFILENYEKQIVNKIDFIKIDCEGFDYKVLDGFKFLLNIIKPVIMVEWFFHINKNKLLFNSIKNIGYIAYDLNGNIMTEDDFGKKCHDLILRPK